MSAKRIDIEKYCGTCNKRFGPEEDLTTCPEDGGLLMPIKHDPLIGSVVAGKFEILDLIGAGGWSTVYRARDTKLGRMVAFKLLRADLASTAEKMQRFEREARIISALSHPNICSVYDYGILPNGQPYLVLEYLTGQTIAEVILSSGVFSPQSTVALMKQTANALTAAHAKDIVHRDLKPANLMLVEERGVQLIKIIDFGLAKTLGALEADQLTHTGLTLGTPSYMSPEQVRGVVLDARSDVYSFGCIMYEMLTGICPISGRNTFEIMQNHLEMVPSIPDPSEQIPQPLKDIVLRCLSKDASERYQSMAELEADLDSFGKTGKLNRRKKPLLNLVSKQRQQVRFVGICAVVLAGLLFTWLQSPLRHESRPALGASFESKFQQLEKALQTDNSVEAKRLGGALIAELRASGKENSPQTVQVAKAMSTYLQKNEEREEAGRYILLALAAQDAMLPKGSDAYLKAHREAIAGLTSGDHKKIEPYYAELLSLTEARYGPSSKEVCQPLESLAWSQLVNRKYQQSDANFTRLFLLVKRYYNPHDYLYVHTLGNLSWVDCNLGDFKKARIYAEQALTLVDDSSPRFHQDLLTTAGLAERKCGYYDKAISDFQQAETIARTVDAGDACRIAGDLGHCLLEAKRYREAAAVLQDAIPKIEKDQGSRSASYKLCLGDFIEVLRRMGQNDKANAIEAAGRI